jgi:hypothetical protein
MRGMPKLLLPCLAFLASCVLCAAQGAQPSPPQAPGQDAAKVLRVADFGGDGISRGESAALQNLITSYVIELKMFRVIDSGGQELALKEAETAVLLGAPKDIAPLSADYVLSATASKLGSVIVFTMDITKVTSGEKKSVADTFASLNDLILAARRLTRGLFEKPQEELVAASPSGRGSGSGGSGPIAGTGAALAAPGAPSAPANPAPSLTQIAGTWKGDKNVDRVTLLPDGRGFAVLSSGFRMAVRALIEGSTVVVRQDQPNSPDFYRPSLDLKSARIVAAAGRPWRWLFSLSPDGESLSGVKESVFVTVNEKGAVSIDNAYVRDAAWKRFYR